MFSTHLRGVLNPEGPGRTAIVWSLALLCVLAFLLRLASIVHPLSSVGTPDWDEYHLLAEGLLERGRYGMPDDWRENPTLAQAQWRYAYDSYGTVRAPGYSILILLVLATVGGGIHLVMVASAALVAATVPIAYLAGRRLAGPWAGLTVAALRAIDPGDVLYLSAAGREPLMGCAVIVGIYFVVAAIQDRKVSKGVWAGLSFGLAGYVKETLAPIGVLAGLAMLVRGALGRDRPMIRTAVPMLLLPVLLIAPWVARNSLAYGRLTGVTTMDGTNLWIGLVDEPRMNRSVDNDLQLGQYLPADLARQYDPYTAGSPSEASRRLREATIVHVKAHRRETIAHMLRNGAYFWSPLSRGAIARGPSLRDPELVLGAFYLGCYGFALAGIWLMRRQFEAHVIWLIFVAVSAMHMPFSFGARMRLPFEALVFLLGAPAMVTAWHRVSRWFGKPGALTPQ
jgi:hypothetical protein